MPSTVLRPEQAQRSHWFVYWWFWFLIGVVPMGLLTVLLPFPANLVLGISFVVWFVTCMTTAAWIPAYHSSLEYTIGDDMIRGIRGVFWKRNVSIPYTKVTNVDISQGPLQRKFAIGTIHIQTAGAGGAQGAIAELRMPGIRDLSGVRDMIMEKVKAHTGRPAGGSPGPTDIDLMIEMVKELKAIRKALTKKS